MCLTKIINRGITDPCINAVADTETQFILLNRDDVSFTMGVLAGLENVVVSGVNKLGKKGYAFNQKKNELVLKDSSAPGTYVPKFTHSLSMILWGESPESIALAEALSSGKFVCVFKKKGDGRCFVAGRKGGLISKSGAGDTADLEIGFSKKIELESINENTYCEPFGVYTLVADSNGVAPGAVGYITTSAYNEIATTASFNALLTMGV